LAAVLTATLKVRGRQN